MAQRVGADPLEADLPDPSAPVVAERVVVPRRARAPEDGRRVLQDEPGLRQQPALLLDSLADDRGGVAVQVDRPHGAVGLGVALDPPVSRPLRQRGALRSHGARRGCAGRGRRRSRWRRRDVPTRGEARRASRCRRRSVLACRVRLRGCKPSQLRRDSACRRTFSVSSRGRYGSGPDCPSSPGWHGLSRLAERGGRRNDGHPSRDGAAGLRTSSVLLCGQWRESRPMLVEYNR